MQPIRSHLVLAALLALAAPVAAQEAQAPAADAPAPETPAPAAPAAPAPAAPAPDAAAPDAAAPEGQATAPAPAEGGAAPAQGQAAAPGQPQPEVMEVIKETFGDWQVRCAPDGKECFMYQLARDAQDNPVAEVSILKLPQVAEADAGVTVVTPLGTLLPQGVVVQIDGGEARQYPFAWCSQVGCFARFGLAPASIDGMKRGNAGKITLHSVGAPQAPVQLDLSLTGFTAAYDALELPPDPPGAAAAPAETPAQPAPEPLPTLEPRN
jgi:invasion protein IalB